MEMPPPSYGSSDTPAQPNALAIPKTMSALAIEWSRHFPKPLTPNGAIKAFTPLVNMGWAIVQQACSGSMCPTRQGLVDVGSLLVKFDEAFKRVEATINGFNVYIDRGAGDVSIQDKYRQKFIEVGTEFFIQAERQMNELGTNGDSGFDFSSVIAAFLGKKKEEAASAFGFWKTAVVIGLGIGGIIAVKDLIRSVRDD